MPGARNYNQASHQHTSCSKPSKCLRCSGIKVHSVCEHNYAYIDMCVEAEQQYGGEKHYDPGGNL